MPTRITQRRHTLPLAALLLLASPVWSADLFVLSVGVEPEDTARGRRDWYARDAEHVRQALTRAEPLYDTVHSRVLAGPKATRTAVLKGLDWLADTVGKDDVAIVFFSAHGAIDDKKGLYVSLAGAVGEAAEKEVLWGSDLHAALAKVRGKSLVWMDACAAGGVLNVGKPVDLPRTAFLLACRDRELSYGQSDRPDRPHGYFVLALCEALDGRADQDKDGVVTLGELESYLPNRSKAFYPRQNAVLGRKPGLASVPLARRDRAVPALELWGAYESRNPFGEPDVFDPDADDVGEFAKTVTLLGGADDLNAKEWARTVTKADVKSIEGEWDSRWRGGDQKWLSGTAQVKLVGDRAYILYKDPANFDYLFDLRREGKDRLVGRYINLDLPTDTSPWVGRIVSAERIDGQWSSGRWDLRRKPAGKNEWLAPDRPVWHRAGAPSQLL